MDKYKKLKREKNSSIFKILISIVFSTLLGYFIYVLYDRGFFEGWEIYFAMACYALIIVTIIIIDIGAVRWICYNISVEDGKLKIRDGFFSRIITIPLERIYFVSSAPAGKGMDYDTLFIIDKKIGHKKVKRLSSDEIPDRKEHADAINWLKEMYPGRLFYYYRVYHHGYKFSYFFYLIYKNCDRCRLSETSMGLVKDFHSKK